MEIDPEITRVAKLLAQHGRGNRPYEERLGEAWEIVTKARASYDAGHHSGATLKTYITRAAKNRIIDGLRRKSCRVRRAGHPVTLDHVCHLADRRQGPAALAELREEVERCGAIRDEEAILLGRGLTYTVIAADTGRPVGTIKSRINRMRRSWRAA